MAPPANTSGPLLVVLMNRTFPVLAPVSLGALMETVFPRLLGRTTSVKQE